MYFLKKINNKRWSSRRKPKHHASKQHQLEHYWDWTSQSSWSLPHLRAHQQRDQERTRSQVTWSWVAIVRARRQAHTESKEADEKVSMLTKAWTLYEQLLFFQQLACCDMFNGILVALVAGSQWELKDGYHKDILKYPLGEGIAHITLANQLFGLKIINRTLSRLSYFSIKKNFF